MDTQPPDAVPPEPALPSAEPVTATVSAPASPAPPVTAMPVRRRFSWRDFLLGVATGVVVALGGLIVIAIGLVMFAANAINEENAGGGMESALSAPRLPAPDRLTAFGQADLDWSFQTLEGERASLRDYGGKVIFLNVWATWCGPCIAEMASLERLRTSVANDPIAFVFVSEEDVSKIKPFVEKRSLKLPIFRAPSLPHPFQTSAIPATFVIDRSGTVVLKHIGAADWGSESAVKFMQTLAGGGRARIEK